VLIYTCCRLWRTWASPCFDLNAIVNIEAGQELSVLPSLVSAGIQPKSGTTVGKLATREEAVAEDMQDVVSDEQHSQGLVPSHSIAQSAF
jgi:hypothetical protein